MRYGRLAITQAAVLATLVAFVAPACASERPAFELTSFSPFGSFSFPTSVAIDPSTEEVLVADGSPANVVDVFGLEGGSSPLGVLAGNGSESFGFAHESAGVAVDNDPASASFHDVYVSDVAHGVVDKFKRTGPGAYEYVCQFNGWYAPGEEACHASGGTPEEPFKEPLGVAVDAQGDVYIASFEPEKGAVDEFDSAGKSVVRVKGTEHPLLIGHPQGVAVDSTGNIFVLNYQSGKRVVELRRASLTGAVESEHEITSPGAAIAIDPTNDDLYVSFGAQIAQYHLSGSGGPELAGEFGSGILGNALGIAVNGAANTIYASDAANLDAAAFLAKTVKVPDVKGTCTASAVTTTGATLHGEVDPLGTEGAQYTFEYGLEGLEHQIGGTLEGTGFKPVFAEIGGLLPGETYRCRLSATDTEGLAGGLVNVGTEGTFQTPPLLPIVDEPLAFATEITTNSAILNGVVNPGNGPTTYHFAYGPAAHEYTHVLSNVGIGTGLTPIPVEQAPSFASLHPNATVHFALIATNAAGTTVGADRTFTTLPAGSSPENPPVVSTGPAEAIAQNTATLTGMVYPENTPTTYRFELGSTPAYGTTIFGGEAGSEHGAVHITQPVANLQPGVTYHYRLLAANAAGTTIGPDRAFTTTTFPQEIVQPLTPALVPIPVFPKVKNPPIKHPRKKKKPKKHHRKAKHAKAGGR